jgi:hypothetical protein
MQATAAATKTTKTKPKTDAQNEYLFIRQLTNGTNVNFTKMYEYLKEIKGVQSKVDVKFQELEHFCKNFQSYSPEILEKTHKAALRRFVETDKLRKEFQTKIDTIEKELAQCGIIKLSEEQLVELEKFSKLFKEYVVSQIPVNKNFDAISLAFEIANVRISTEFPLNALAKEYEEIQLKLDGFIMKHVNGNFTPEDFTEVKLLEVKLLILSKKLKSQERLDTISSGLKKLSDLNGEAYDNLCAKWSDLGHTNYKINGEILNFIRKTQIISKFDGLKDTISKESEKIRKYKRSEEIAYSGAVSYYIKNEKLDAFKTTVQQKETLFAELTIKSRVLQAEMETLMKGFETLTSDDKYIKDLAQGNTKQESTNIAMFNKTRGDLEQKQKEIYALLYNNWVGFKKEHDEFRVQLKQIQDTKKIIDDKQFVDKFLVHKKDVVPLPETELTFNPPKYYWNYSWIYG